MTLMKLQFKAGYYRDSTRYTTMGAWWDGDYVRFCLGQPESIGGWVKAISTQFLGSCRLMHEWGALNSDTIIAMGTHLKFYLNFGGAYYDITPIRKTTNPMTNNPFAVTNGNPIMTVTDNSHGAGPGDYVTFSGASTFAGLSSAALNKEFSITQVLSGNSYTVTLSETPNANISGGGAAVVAAYQVNTGLDTSTSSGTGWGAGPWGGAYLGAGTDTGWGQAANLSVSANQRIGMWSAMNYGEDLIFNQRDGSLFYWDWTTGYNARGVYLTAQTGATSVPQVATEVTVSAERHVIAFGADPFDNPGVQDRALIRFSSQESSVDWLPTNLNTAGDLRLILGSTFVTHIQTSQEILVWSNTSLHSMRYVGAPFYYGISVLASKATVIGPKAKAVMDDAVYWMAKGAFYRYAGRVEMLPCPILDNVFDNINPSQAEKIYCATNSLYGEVMWFIPEEGEQEVSRCVIYNTIQNIWYYNTMSRTCWMDRVSSAYPQATSGGYLYFHENGATDGSTTPASAITSYLESAPVELGDGEKIIFANRFIPDISFRESESAGNPSVTVTLIPQNYPGSAYLTPDTAGGTVTRTSTVTVEQFTEKIDVRLRGRSIAMRIDSSTAGVRWHLGTPRLDGKPDGGRV